MCELAQTEAIIVRRRASTLADDERRAFSIGRAGGRVFAARRDAARSARIVCEYVTTAYELALALTRVGFRNALRVRLAVDAHELSATADEKDRKARAHNGGQTVASAHHGGGGGGKHCRGPCETQTFPEHSLT